MIYDENLRIVNNGQSAAKSPHSIKWDFFVRRIQGERFRDYNLSVLLNVGLWYSPGYTDL